MDEQNFSLPKTYSPKNTEDRIYKLWEKNDAFLPRRSGSEDGPNFSVVLPPPNVTGSLHMGHALNATCQDILVRRARMQGRPTVWVPGTDHAGIATQNVVEKNLAKKGIKKQDLGREKFIDEVWKWVKEYRQTIPNQLKKIGASCDWSRERFTMDEDYQAAVNFAFKHYYDRGLIYQGERVVNWCVHCQTALSDIEVEYKEAPGKLYYFKYDKDFPITIATTRPETKLGDVAVAVNPQDKRYKQYVGQIFDVDFVGHPLKIKIIADPSIDKNFGSGAVGVTPAHSITDAELAEKHELPTKTIIDKYGKIQGRKTQEVREEILSKLQERGLLEKTQDIIHDISVCYRCGREIEPQPSRQWFLKMKELIKPAIAAIEKDEIKITPARWKKVYLEWMKNIHDWCISRQLWWGQRLPIEGETDVLDTWFSSALWPFAVFAWPKETNDLQKFYPTSVLSTARDINMLWVVRMIFSGLEFTKEIPFERVYVHPTVFNKEGKRMSKSLGTGIDPLELVDKYGADAVRFGLAYINTGTQDIKFDEAAILMGQKFANKVWNVARFVISQTDNKLSVINDQYKSDTDNPSLITDNLNQNDKDILDKLAQLANSLNKQLDAFQYGQAAHALYDFVWHDFADIYIEQVKSQKSKIKNQDDVLLYILTSSLRLLHPFMPFVTEEIWQNLYAEKLVSEKMLINARWIEK